MAEVSSVTGIILEMKLTPITTTSSTSNFGAAEKASYQGKAETEETATKRFV
jgi:hypothetical protein